ncbi:MAG: Hsp70 family protein [Acidobacteria bacterium]|nr:Hsp70 family protein [Acidobacteriota bacterium]
MSKTIGIDLGTTFSAVAIVENGRPRLITRRDERLVPSVVGLDEAGRIIVGQAALNQYVLAPERTIRSVKRRMGSAERLKLGEREYLPQEISAFILRYLAQMAEEALGYRVKRAVITVPAYFNDAQRQATKEAGELAGLEVVRIINEPTAAALAYGLDQKKNQYLLVYDLGGGTFDVSIVEQQEEVLEVRASHGNVHLGGDDFDERLLQHMLAHLSSEHRYDFKQDRRAMARLLRAAERAKIQLSDKPYVHVGEEFLARYDDQVVHLNMEVARDQFEGMIKDLLQSTLQSIDQALTDAELKAEDIDQTLLVGGSTRIPRVWELLQEKLLMEPSLEINPDEAVALGAAVQAAIIDGEDVQAMLIDVAPHSLGIEIAEIFHGLVIPGKYKSIIRRNTTVPTTKAERFYTITPDQDTVHLRVFQGESPIAEENTLLGELLFEHIPPAEDPTHNREIIVEFSYNLDGVVEVTARDLHGTRQECTRVSTTPAKREVRTVAHTPRLELALEKEVTATLRDAARVQLQVEAAGNTKAKTAIAQARETLEAAHARGDQKGVRKALDKLQDLLYEYEEA